jgi:transcriptional regulator with XRE-family HTH domain
MSQNYFAHSLGAAFRRMRQDAQLRQMRVADALNFGQANISRFEHGVQWVESADRLQAFARAIGLPLSAVIIAAEHPRLAPDDVRKLAAIVEAQATALARASNRRSPAAAPQSRAFVAAP